MVEWGVWWVLAIVVFLAKVLMLVELIVFDMVLTFTRSVIGYCINLREVSYWVLAHFLHQYGFGPFAGLRPRPLALLASALLPVAC